MFSRVRSACVLLVLLSVLTGLLYPLAITAIAQILFPSEANGSLVTRNGKAVGSRLIGQYFTDPRYFWGRPSATAPHPYAANASNASNVGPTNPVLGDSVRTRIQRLHDTDTRNADPVPIDLVTSSGSGLDPHISVDAAMYQSHRIARVRGMTDSVVAELIAHHVIQRDLGILGEPRVNVLELNLALDQQYPTH